MVAEVTRSLFDTARQYRESFDVTGSKKSFEWQQVENEEPVIHTKGLPEPARSRSGSRCRTTPAGCRSRSAVHAAGAIQDAEHLSSSRAAATAAATRTWPTTS